MSPVALVVTVGLLVATLARGPNASAGPTFALLLGAFIAFFTMLFTEHERPRLDRRIVLGASAVVLAVAVAVPPTESRDVWFYAIEGRIVAHHHANPYTRVPADFPTDPVLRRVDPAWYHTRTPYGPGFTTLAGLATDFAGTSPLGLRLFFQGLAALAVAVALLLLLLARGAEPGALALIGLNPLVVISVVNGGHNDALVGLAVLGGALLLVTGERTAGKIALAGVVLAGAILVKLTALLLLGAVAVWAWRRIGGRATFGMVTLALLVVATGYARVGYTATTRSLDEARLQVSNTSVWNPVVRGLTNREVDKGRTRARASTLVRRRVTRWAEAAVLALALLLVVGVRGHRDATLAVGAVVAAYLLLAPYVSPWYATWGLLALATVWRSPITIVVAVQAALLQLADLPVPHLVVPTDPLRVRAPFERLAADLGQVLVPMLEVVLIVIVVAGTFRRRARHPRGPLAAGAVT